MRPHVERLRDRTQTSLQMRVLVWREGGEPTFDPVTLEMTDGKVTVWEGSALVMAQQKAEVTVEAGAFQTNVSDYDVVLPWDALFKTKDRLTVLAAPDAPEMVGKEFVVRDDPSDGWNIARRAVVQLVE